MGVYKAAENTVCARQAKPQIINTMQASFPRHTPFVIENHYLNLKLEYELFQLFDCPSWLLSGPIPKLKFLHPQLSFFCRTIILS